MLRLAPDDNGGTLGDVRLSLEDGETIAALLTRVPGHFTQREQRATNRLQRQVEKAQSQQLAFSEPFLPEIYGNHQIIPENWAPAHNTVTWTMQQLSVTSQAFDLDWLVAEFISFWRARGRAMADWQQAWRNNILNRIAKGQPLASDRPDARENRIFDRGLELQRQRLADFDDEAAEIAGAAGRKTHAPLGSDD